MSKSWAGGSSWAWRKTRRAVLIRDGHRCQLKLPGCTTIATEAHHTRPRETVGDNPAYLRAACSDCNKQAGDPRRHDPPAQPRRQW